LCSLLETNTIGYYAPLIAATPTRQDATRAVNTHARREQRRIRIATYADQQVQQRAQWRVEADAIAQHRLTATGHMEDIRKAQAGLRAEMKAGNRAGTQGTQAWLRLLRQLHSQQQG